jgi:hypothetical protein
MAASEISICNLALGMIGADSIRSFDEDNKRARLCKVFYEHARDQILFLADWSFSRRYVTIRRIDHEEMGIQVPEGISVYAKPADCMCPRDVGYFGSREWWRINGEYIWLRLSLDEVGLFYSAKIVNTVQFSEPFIEALSLHLAFRLAMPVAQNREIANALFQQFQVTLNQYIADDANQGSEYKYPDDIADLDTFVNTDRPSIMTLDLKPWLRFTD